MKTKLEKIQELAEKKKVGKLVHFTGDSDVEVRAAAYRALGDCGGEEAMETCQNSIRDPEPKVRLAIAEAFQKMGDDHVSEALRHQMLSETDPEVKAALEKAVDFNRGRRGGA